MGPDLSGVRAEVAAALVAGTGLRTATDPGKAHAPGLLVGPITEVTRDTGCTFRVTLPVFLVHPAPADGRAADWLAAHIGPVLLALPGEAGEARLGTVAASGTGDLPCYETDITILTEGTTAP